MKLAFGAQKDHTAVHKLQEFFQKLSSIPRAVQKLFKRPSNYSQAFQASLKLF
jgi:hypothetical protein